MGRNHQANGVCLGDPFFLSAARALLITWGYAWYALLVTSDERPEDFENANGSEYHHPGRR